MAFPFTGAPMSAARRMMSQGQEALQERGSQLREGMQNATDSAREMASNYYHQGRQQLRHSADQVTHFVEDQPIRTTLFALGIGCLIAAMLIRR